MSGNSYNLIKSYKASTVKFVSVGKLNWTLPNLWYMIMFEEDFKFEE